MGKQIAFSLLIADILLKWLAVGGDYAVINQGISFGVKMSSEWLIFVVSAVIFVWLYRNKMWFILAGGAANLLSRVVWGGVVDYWNFWGWFSNNLADWMIVVGAIYALVQYSHEYSNNI